MSSGLRLDQESTRLNSSHTVIYTLSLHDASPIFLVITRDAVILVGAGILHYFIGNKMRIKPSWTGKVATVCQMCAIAWVMLQLQFLDHFSIERRDVVRFTA